MPSPLTIASQKRVAVIGYNSETSLQGWLMSAYHHSNGSKLGSSHYLKVFWVHEQPYAAVPVLSAF